jgi:hypothetical protein
MADEPYCVNVLTMMYRNTSRCFEIRWEWHHICIEIICSVNVHIIQCSCTCVHHYNWCQSVKKDLYTNLQEKQRKSPNFQIFTQNKMYICSYQNLHLCFNTHVRQWLHLISQKCYLGQKENTSLIRVKSPDACIVT